MICNRVNHVSTCLEELKQLAAKRREDLEESRQLWAFFQVGGWVGLLHTHTVRNPLGAPAVATPTSGMVL